MPIIQETPEQTMARIKREQEALANTLKSQEEGGSVARSFAGTNVPETLNQDPALRQLLQESVNIQTGRKPGTVYQPLTVQAETMINKKPEVESPITTPSTPTTPTGYWEDGKFFSSTPTTGLGTTGSTSSLDASLGLGGIQDAFGNLFKEIDTSGQEAALQTEAAKQKASIDDIFNQEAARTQASYKDAIARKKAQLANLGLAESEDTYAFKDLRNMEIERDRAIETIEQKRQAALASIDLGVTTNLEKFKTDAEASRQKAFDNVLKMTTFISDLQQKAQSMNLAVEKMKNESEKDYYDRQMSVIETALKLPEGKKVNLGDGQIIEGLKQVSPEIQTWKTEDENGNVSLVVLDKNTLQTSVIPVGKLGVPSKSSSTTGGNGVLTKTTNFPLSDETLAVLNGLPIDNIPQKVRADVVNELTQIAMGKGNLQGPVAELGGITWGEASLKALQNIKSGSGNDLNSVLSSIGVEI